MAKIYKKNDFGVYSRPIYYSFVFYIFISFLLFFSFLFLYIFLKKIHIEIKIIKYVAISMFVLFFVLFFLKIIMIVKSVKKYRNYSIYLYSQKFKKNIQKNLIDTLKLNKMDTTPYIEVPDIDIKYNNNNIIVQIERLPNMNDVDELMLLISNAFRGKYCDYSVVDYRINENINEYTFFLEDVNIQKRLIPKTIEELIVKNPYEVKIQKNLNWNMNKQPHCIVTGRSGSGKSTFLISLLLQYFYKKIPLYIIDPKQEFSAYSTFYENIYSHKEDILHLMNEFIQILENREKEVKNEIKKIGQVGATACDLGFEPIVLLIDELSAFVSLLDSKEKKLFDNYLTVLVQKGRSVGITIIVSMQNANSETIKVAVRNQFSLRILLGNSTKEDVQFMFGTNNDTVNYRVEAYTGYYTLDGVTLTPQKLEITDIVKYRLSNIDTIKKIME